MDLRYGHSYSFVAQILIFESQQAAELTAGFTDLAKCPNDDTVLSFLRDAREKDESKLRPRACGKEECRKCEQKEKECMTEDPEEIELNEAEEEFRKNRKENPKLEQESQCEEYERSLGLRMKQTMANVIAFYNSGLNIARMQ